MATLIKNHTTGAFEKSTAMFVIPFGITGQTIDFAGPVANFTATGWLYCDGAEYSTTDYPNLYAVIGNTYGGTTGSTFCVPDYRETVRVGAGTSTRAGIAAHDVYDVGEFKDDQAQSHTHTCLGAWEYSATPGYSASNTNSQDNIQTTSVNNGRRGTTTHGKQIGVNTFIHV